MHCPKRLINRSSPSTFLLSSTILALALMAGCGGNDEGQPEDSSESSPEQQPLVADDESPKKSIVGIWYGVATIDQQKLQTKLNSIDDPAKKTELEQVANSFLTTHMGAEFSENGELKFDLEFRAVNGQLLEGTSWGTWKLVNQTDEFIIIEKTENFDDGTSETKLVRYDFRKNEGRNTATGQFAKSSGSNTGISNESPDQFEFAYPHPDLLDCQPMIVFERRSFDQAKTPKVADQNSSRDSEKSNQRQ